MNDNHKPRTHEMGALVETLKIVDLNPVERCFFFSFIPSRLADKNK